MVVATDQMRSVNLRQLSDSVPFERDAEVPRVWTFRVWIPFEDVHVFKWNPETKSSIIIATYYHRTDWTDEKLELWELISEWISVSH